MKIGFFNSIVFDRHSGGRTRAMNIYRDLSENYEVEFINLSLPNKSKPSGDINYFDASWKSRFLPTHACRLITVLRALNYSIKKGFDIGYAYRSVGGVPIVAFMFSLLARKKLILGVNDFPSNNETLLSSTFVKNFIRTYILNKSDAVIAEYNEKIVSHLLELGVSKQKIKILPSRIEIKEYDFNPLPKNQVLKIFYVGRDQDIDLLINSARKLNKKYDKAKFIIAGVEEKGHPEIDNIQYLGKIPHSEVKNLLSTADVCVVPYSKPTTAGVPVKIFEYMASGKCIVATNLSSNTSVLEDGKTAIISEPSVGDFTNSLVVALNNPSLRRELGEKTYEEVKKFSREEVINQLRDIIGEL